MSSKAEEELKVLAQEAMADDYLCKPFTADQLTAKILKLLS
jgi:DNA-binding response OmpR family regulator